MHLYCVPVTHLRPVSALGKVIISQKKVLDGDW